ncbi:uncharacterized protein LOC127739184 [Mytilus californianus]|uniref:uncharacterized protein LOC127739184 n=1 Tax=Mytilus californianus TaxID=6549 RepID=UPI0022477567|nr:uncharacterized protein LOC127739184 [Mytilus californianus]
MFPSRKSINKSAVIKTRLTLTVEEERISEWKKQKNCDIEIRCGEFQTKAHCCVLSNISDYFTASLNFNRFQTRKCILNKEFVFSEALCQVINFAYTGFLEISSYSVHSLIATASYLQAKLIIDECEKFLINSIDRSSAVSLLPIAILFYLSTLIDTIVLWISENFYTCVEQNSFSSLSNDDFKFLLRNRNLSAFRNGIPVDNPELNILDAVGKTLTANQVYDMSTVKHILSAILFSEIPEDDLSSIYDIYPAFHTIDRSTFTTLQTSDLKERKFSNSSKILESCMSYLEVPDHLNFVKCFENVPSINDRPKKVGLWVTRWEGFIAIGGIRVEYKSRTSVLHGIRPKARHSILSEHEFELDEDEVITGINLRSGMLTDSISFFTNYGRTYGPYGSNSGYPSSSSPSKQRGYFHSFRGIVLKGRYDHFIAIIDCTWVVFKMTNTDYDRIVKESSKFDDYIRMRVNFETDWRKHFRGSGFQSLTSVVESVDSEPYVVFENKASLSYKF